MAAALDVAGIPEEEKQAVLANLSGIGVSVGVQTSADVSVPVTAGDNSSAAGVAEGLKQIQGAMEAVNAQIPEAEQALEAAGAQIAQMKDGAAQAGRALRNCR